MITINLYDYKRIITEVRVQQRITAAAALVLSGLILVGAYWGLQRIQVSEQKAETERVRNATSLVILSLLLQLRCHRLLFGGRSI